MDDQDDGEDGSFPGTLIDFEAAYLANRDKLRGVAAATLRPAGLESQAEDVVQKALAELWPKRDDPPASWVALMVTVVKRRAIDAMKASNVTTAGPSLDDLTGQREVPGPDSFSDAIARRSAVRLAVRHLADPQQRDVLHRIYYLRDKQSEIAKDLGLSPGRISQIHTAAIKELARTLEPFEGGDGSE